MRMISSALALAALVAISAPGYAQSYGQIGSENGYRHDRAPQHRYHNRNVTRSNRGSDCPNGDCRGVNSPGNMGGAPGDF